MCIISYLIKNYQNEPSESVPYLIENKNIIKYEQQLKQKLKARVNININHQNKGTINIKFTSIQHLKDLIKLLKNEK